MAIGGQFGGYSLYMKDGYLNFSYNYLGDVEYKTTSKKVVSKGKHTVKSEFVYDGDGLGKGGILNLYVDGKKMASGRVEQTMPFVYSTSEGASVGWDDSSNVSADYGIGKKNKFDGSIGYVKVSLKN